MLQSRKCSHVPLFSTGATADEAQKHLYEDQQRTFDLTELIWSLCEILWIDVAPGMVFTQKLCNDVAPGMGFTQDLWIDVAPGMVFTQNHSIDVAPGMVFTPKVLIITQVV